MSVDDYLAGATLWRTDGNATVQIAGAGELTAERLDALGRANPGASLELRHVGQPLSGAEYRTWRRRADRPSFRPSSRFAAVGLTSLLLDAFMRLSLVLRGKVPGGTRPPRSSRTQPVRRRRRGPAHPRVTAGNARPRMAR